ncbi:MAG: lipopolysaccharide heptosyltransferase II [Geobacteraceae bacterium]|nr:lipopolysaccharide heptosyltransferase II [Geobacteraceae bacterium]
MSSPVQQKILVLRYRFIGDTILTVPFLRNLRHARPEAWITWVVAPGSAEVVKGIPYVDELLYWDPVTIHADSRGTHKTLKSRLDFVRELRRRKFDTVYVLKRSFSSAVMALLSGARRRIGFNTEGRGFLLTKRVPYQLDCHEVINFLDVLRADGIKPADDHLEAWIEPAEDCEARLLMGSGRDFLAIHPFASSGVKSWPLERFAAVAHAAKELYGLTAVVLGGARDLELARAVSGLFPEGTLNLAGACSLRVTMAVLARSVAFVGNDSGVMHLAAAAGIPLVAVFGPTSPVRFGPWGVNSRIVYSGFPCSPCRQRPFTECEPSLSGRPRCIDEISESAVIDALTLLLSKRVPEELTPDKQDKRILTEAGV